jgi:hypothetical protein
MLALVNCQWWVTFADDDDDSDDERERMRMNGRRSGKDEGSPLSLLLFLWAIN